MKLRFEILRFSLLYQAFEGQHQLVGYADGKALDAEMLVDLHRAEVRAQRAVSLTGDGDGTHGDRNDVLVGRFASMQTNRPS